MSTHPEADATTLTERTPNEPSGPPRIPPLTAQEATGDAADIIANWPYNLHKTLAHNPETMTAWMGFAEHILLKNSLSERDREIAILRVAANTRANYEWGMHAMVARRVGMSEDDISACLEGPASPHWEGHESALVQAVDDIMQSWKIGDGAWTALRAVYSEKQLIDFVFVTGNFMLIAVALNSFQIALEPGLDTLPQ